MTQRNTKEKIFDVSLELFSQKGFNNTSVRQIAREVGIKESSIYNHYPSKQAILDEILKTFQRGRTRVGSPSFSCLDCNIFSINNRNFAAQKFFIIIL